MPLWLINGLKAIGTIGKFLLPDLIKYAGEALRKWFKKQKTKRQDESNKDKAKKYEKDKSRSSADDLIDGL